MTGISPRSSCHFLPVGHPRRRVASAKAELGVRPRDHKTTRQHDRSFRLVETSSSESGQLPDSPASVGPPNNRQRITDNRAKGASAFTLIELIVVILIIMTLAALVMTAASGVLDHAKKTQAKNDVTQIVTAVNAFYSEYGKYPVPAGTTTDAFFGTGTAPAGCTTVGNNNLLFDALRGLDPTTNPRAIVFLSPKTAKNTTPPKGGISQSTGTVGQYMDVWGSQYAIAIDSDYNNQISNPYSDSDGSAGTSPLRFGVIAYSYGKNGARGGGAASSPFAAENGSAGIFKGSSDILSWQ